MSGNRTRITLLGSGIAADHAEGVRRRYNLANPCLDAYLSAHPVLGERVEVSRMDLSFALDGSHGEEVLREVLDREPEVLGLSCYVWDMEPLMAVAAKVRQARPSTRIVIGGPSPTFHTRRILEANPAVDVAVRGEGEETFAEVLLSDFRDLSGIAGVSWRDAEGEVHEERDRGPVADLSTLRSPILDGKIVPPRENLLLEFSRGCIYKCKHCAWQTHGSGVRNVPAARVRGEAAWAREHGYDHVFVIDSDINSNPAWLATLTDAIQAGDPGGKVLYSYFINYRSVTPEQTSLLRKIRTHEILLGLESVNPSALKATGRKSRLEDEFGHATDLLAEVGPITPNVMFGMPGDNLDGFRRTLDYIAMLAERPGPRRIRQARIHWAIVPPGSYFSENAERYGIRVHDRGVPYVLGTREFPEDDLRRGLELMANHPRADLFIWEDAEPHRILGGEVPEMFAIGGGRLGAPVPDRIRDEHVLAAISPLVPGRPMPRGWSVEPLTRVHGQPVVTFAGPGGRRLRVAIRPRDTTVTAHARTPSFDVECLTAQATSSGSDEQRIFRALVELISKNDRGGREGMRPAVGSESKQGPRATE